jgi:lipoprotein-anchoring transpeptidase ErfK/SrfK
MDMIKKNITIILISAAIAAAIVFVDKVISADQLGDPPSESGESINSSASDDAVDAGIIENERKFDFEMAKQDFFIVVPEGTNKDDDDDKSSVGTEAAIEKSGTASDIEIQEDIQIDLDSEQAEIAANSDNTETAPDENMGDNQQTFLNEENIDFSDSGNFRIEIDLSRQRVTVFYKDDILREMICSGGAPESPTPPGEFVTSQKIEYAFVERFDVGAYYWIRFFEDYLIHSVPFDENGEMIIEEFEKLGSPASHGCIRLKLEEAKWLYETLPLGVKVSIY